MIQIKDLKDCCGCTSCASVCARNAITMRADNEGFSYPDVNTNLCVQCGLCELVCPIKYRDVSVLSTTPSVYAMTIKDEITLNSSSSGGVFSALCDYVFKNNGVVYGATFNKKLEVVHSPALNAKEAKQFRGSKYVQSSVEGVFQNVKKELGGGKIVLFSGTPCQVEGLKCFLRKPYDNLITCDIICHSVPSPKIFKDYLQFVESKYGREVLNINMKDKTRGWKSTSPRIFFHDGTNIFSAPEAGLWLKIFYSNLVSRPSCHECRFCNPNRPGDITIGDFWGIENVHPEMFNEKGVSLVFLNTDKGKVLFESIKDKFKYKQSSFYLCKQSNLVEPTKSSSLRNQFWDDYPNKDFIALCKKYFQYRDDLWFLLKNKIKNVSKRLW